jgi:uncharacterized protein (DUF2235 family)
MSLNIVKKNSSSPFLLQRSMVNQGGEGGVYEEGGYNPNTVYSDSGISEGISGFGDTMSKVIASRTAEDENNSNITKKKRLENRKSRLTKAKDTSSEKRDIRIDARLAKIKTKTEKTEASIKKYSEFEKPTIKSDITK